MPGEYTSLLSLPLIAPNRNPFDTVYSSYAVNYGEFRENPLIKSWPVETSC